MQTPRLLSFPSQCALVLAVVLLFLAASASTVQRERKPNIVILLADDLGYADVGFNGCKDIPTPNLDALAKSGVRCTNGYVSGVYCSPTRAGLLTGRYQNRFGHEFNPGEGTETPNGMPVGETTLADRLKAVGYATGLVGKWHLGGAPQFHPNRRGFEEFFGFLGGMNAFLPQQPAGAVPNILRNGEPVQEKEYLTDAFAREALSFIDRHKRQPFLLYLAFNAVHTPMHATDARLQRFAGIQDPQRRTYAAMLVAMDEAVGKMMEKLRADRLEEETLVFFFSDNGGPTMQGTTINGSRNDPFRGSKRQTLEGGIHVPFVVSWKGHLPAGKTYERPVIQLDVLPTALAAAGVKVPAGAKLDGVNLLPYLDGRNNRPPHDTLTWRFGAMMAIRQGDWKLVRYDGTPAKLYNLARDPGEAQDLAASEAERAARMQSAWEQWNSQLVDPLWGGGRRRQQNNGDAGGPAP